MKWNQEFNTVSLGARWYRNAIKTHQIDDGGMAFEVGAAMITEEEIPHDRLFFSKFRRVCYFSTFIMASQSSSRNAKVYVSSASESDDLGLPFWFNL